MCRFCFSAAILRASPLIWLTCSLFSEGKETFAKALYSGQPVKANTQYFLISSGVVLVERKVFCYELVKDLRSA